MMRVGAGAAAISTRIGEPLAGYAARTGGCTGILDPLQATVIRFDDGVTATALVVLDLLYVPASLDREVRGAVSEAAGVDPAAVTVCATHTHCAPANLATDPDVRGRVRGAAGSAAAAALRTSEPADLAVGSRDVPGIGANRRAPAGRADDRAQVLVARARDGSRTIATVVSFACHATVLGPATTDSSADFPGAACRLIEQQAGGVAAYLQGAAGDVNPVIAAPTPAECLRLGGILAAAAVSVVLAATGLQQGLVTESPTLQASFPAGHLAGCRQLEDPRLEVRWAEAEVDPAPPLAPAGDIARARQELAGPPGAQDAQLWIQQLRAAEPNLFGVFDPGPPPRLRVQMVALDPSLALLALPGEPFTATAAALRAAAPGDLLVAGYAHQSVGYLPPRAAWELGGYEVGCCLYTDTVEARLRSAALALLGSPLGPRGSEQLSEQLAAQIASQPTPPPADADRRSPPA